MCYGGCDCARCSGEPPVLKQHKDGKKGQELHEIIQQATEMIVRYGGIDGAHHKDWVLDQVVRILTGPRYEEVVRAAKAGEDGPDTYDWNVGIAP